MERVCEICGISGRDAQLHKAINGKELIFACPKCIEMEELILIKEPTEEQINYANKPYSVKERLARAMGGREARKEDKPTVSLSAPQALYCISPYRKVDLPIKLVDNFNWKIMMARRGRKMSQEALASKIGEPLALVKSIESGCIGRDCEKALEKLEQVFGISLIRQGVTQPQQQVQSQARQSQPAQQTSGKIFVTKDNIRTLRVQDLIQVREEMANRKNMPQVQKDEAPEESEEEIDLEEEK